jgi:hypothetical protein
VGVEVEVKFDNKKDVDISLWNVRLESYKGDERSASRR